ncbi:hypothetical protein AKJ09_07502 [Labilithrix luteola]|uniref:Lipoprotein n=1 Tax=Labilithrix luteola TaxID=1391654 RepID=A0A0K1Q547_9BACT|nr:hypothetical protein AKJ09_07502 [Labilithrix luteola]
MGARFALRAGAVGLLLASLVPACSQGEGDGQISGTLDVLDCWTGAFDLDPDFFAAVPYLNTLQMRIQNGSDFETFSDGVSIMLYDTTKVRPNPALGIPGQYGVPLEVNLPPEVTPPGVPVRADPNPAIVSLTLYLQKSCRVQNVSLYAVKEVTLPTDGTCDARPMKGADPNAGCDPNTESPGGVGNGKSLISFTHLFNGQVDEATASERLSSGCFDVYLADPREVAPGGLGPPPPCRGHIKGTFSFFFERGRPSQPFP